MSIALKFCCDIRLYQPKGTIRKESKLVPLTQKRGLDSKGGMSLVSLLGITVCAEVVVTNASKAAASVVHDRNNGIVRLVREGMRVAAAGSCVRGTSGVLPEYF